jgi:hypothetical protein
VLRKRLNPGTEPISKRRELSERSAGTVRVTDDAVARSASLIRYSARPTFGVPQIFGALLMRRPSRAGRLDAKALKG